MPDNTGEIQAGQFKPGQSGNPIGRPKGSRNRATLAVQEMLEGEAEAITRQVIELAKAGDMAAIKLVLERVLPPRKDAPISITLPNTKTVEDVAAAIAGIIQAVCAGQITPSEGHSIVSLLESQRKCIETTILERKLDALKTLLEYRK